MVYIATGVPQCRNCGQCCFLMNQSMVPSDKKCKHLVILKSGRTLCRIYNKRLRHNIGKAPDGNPNHCWYREDQKINFKACPYNKPGQPEYEIDIRKRKVRKL